VRRREFITLLGGAAAASSLLRPLAARAQQPAIPVVGFINTASAEPFAHLVAAFRKGLSNAGFSDGQNVTIEYRWAEGHYDRLAAFASELIRRPVAVLAATGGDPAVLAARAVTTTTPVVFITGSDPVALGYVDSLNRPGGNATGVTQLTSLLGAKRIGLLRELAPNADPIAVLINPNFTVSAAQYSDAQEAARAVGVRCIELQAAAESEFEPAFASLVQQRAGALMIAADPYFNSRRQQLVALAARYRVPTIYEFREFAAAGGLISYGTSLADGYAQVGNYVGRILKGTRPAELPVVQSARFELVINLKAAKTLGVQVPPGLSASADEVIE
jgi:putative tryptophan/tyrosine transport system substrate-binding protein